MARRDPSVFDRTAKGYGRVRPGYPEALYDWVIATAGLESGANLLELGCGPGLATMGFAKRGYAIHAIDASSEMLAEARNRLSGKANVRFEQALFEAWGGPAKPVDMVYAGMAWHWLDPDVREHNVASWMGPGGTLAILVNWPVTPLAEVQDIYASFWPVSPPPFRRTLDQRIEQVYAEFDVHNIFSIVDMARWPRQLVRSADEYLQILETYTDHIVLPDNVKRPFYAAMHQRIVSLGGTITQNMESVAFVARRREV